MLNGIAFLFIVEDLGASLDFYTAKLGFEVAYNGESPDLRDMVRRDDVTLMLKPDHA